MIYTLTMSGGEIAIIVLLGVVVCVCSYVFTKMILKQKKEIKELEERANKRKEERAARRRR